MLTYKKSQNSFLQKNIYILIREKSLTSEENLPWVKENMIEQ